jgi:hypothetical protein
VPGCGHALEAERVRADVALRGGVRHLQEGSIERALASSKNAVYPNLVTTAPWSRPSPTIPRVSAASSPPPIATTTRRAPPVAESDRLFDERHFSRSSISRPQQQSSQREKEISSGFEVNTESWF